MYAHMFMHIHIYIYMHAHMFMHTHGHYFMTTERCSNVDRTEDGHTLRHGRKAGLRHTEGARVH